MVSRVAALTSSPRNTGNFVTDHARSNPREGRHLGSLDHTYNEGAPNRNESSWMSAAYSSTKVVVNIVKESSDVFPPLKSVASSLAVILKHYDVRPLSSITSVVLTPL